MNDPIADKRPTLIYLLAASHSGSTLTALLLNSHPNICTVGELKATNLGNVGAYRCSCRAPISECEFWKEVTRKMTARGLDFDVEQSETSLKSIRSRYVQRILSPLVRGKWVERFRDLLLSISPTWLKEKSRWSTRNLALVECVAEFSAARFVVDSSKIAIRLKYLRAFGEIDVKVVRVIRDGRGVALTYMNPGSFADASDPSLRGGGSGKNGNGAPALSMTDAAREWRRSNEEAEQLLKTIPADDCISVRYEDICLDTAGTMGSVFQFLGVESSEAFVKFRENEHHIVGNGMRLDDTNDIELDDRWRQELRETELAEFDRVAGELNRSYGYS